MIVKLRWSTTPRNSLTRMAGDSCVCEFFLVPFVVALEEFAEVVFKSKNIYVTIIYILDDPSA